MKAIKTVFDTYRGRRPKGECVTGDYELQDGSCSSFQMNRPMWWIFHRCEHLSRISAGEPFGNK